MWLQTARKDCYSSTEQKDKACNMVILEVGVGPSVHGLRPETVLLMSDHPESGFGVHANLIRVNPLTAPITSSVSADMWSSSADLLPGKKGASVRLTDSCAVAMKKLHDGVIERYRE